MTDIKKWIEDQREKFIGLSDSVWDFAELGFTEERSSSLLSSKLEGVGFVVQHGVADIPTAFIASYGKGGPVIAILGEYDALPGLSQEKTPFQKPRLGSGNGHGCGHNLLGVAGLAAALAVREELQSGKTKGTIRYYGCPAEENGAAKTFMVKAGVFKDVDLSLCWHPDAYNAPININTLAVINVVFRFHGKAAHASYDPYNGRSALDAVELMNVGANYLREHIIPEGRLHYVITNGGGSAPNVVPPLAESKYLVRAPLMSQAEEIYARLIDIARGASLMTGTKMEIVAKKGMSNLLLNKTIIDTLHEKMLEVGEPSFSKEEVDFARQIATTFSKDEVDGFLGKVYGKQARDLLARQKDVVLFTAVMPNVESDYVLPASTDVGDVSWVTPTGQVTTTCMALGTPSHSWQLVAQAGMGIGHQGMIYAAKVMALAALEFMQKPERLKAARDEFERRLGETPYISPLPEGVKPF
jgi:aminobenzoyl-glutamate utilization protein B